MLLIVGKDDLKQGSAFSYKDGWFFSLHEELFDYKDSVITWPCDWRIFNKEMHIQDFLMSVALAAVTVYRLIFDSINLYFVKYFGGVLQCRTH